MNHLNAAHSLDAVYWVESVRSSCPIVLDYIVITAFGFKELYHTAIRVCDVWGDAAVPIKAHLQPEFSYQKSVQSSVP